MSSASRLFEVPEYSVADLQRGLHALSWGSADIATEANQWWATRFVLVLALADRIADICEEKGMGVGDETILNVAKTLAVDASSRFPEGHPLSSADRSVAVELVYLWAKATWPQKSRSELYADAKQRVAFGERGRTFFHWVGQSVFGFGS